MSDLLARAYELFVAPVDPVRGSGAARRAAIAPPAGAVVAAVLGSEVTAPPVATLLAGELRLRRRAGCALVGEWRAGGAPAPDEEVRGAVAVAGRAARALAARLEGRGLPSVAASGRLVRVSLPAEPEAAAGAWERACAAAGCAAVLAVAGARPAAFGDLLDGQDLVALVLDPAAGELASLAQAGLVGVRAPVIACRPVPAGVARLAAASSVATSRALGAELAGAVRALA